MGADRSPARYRSIATRLTYRRPVFTAILAQVDRSSIAVKVGDMVAPGPALVVIEAVPAS